MATVVLKDGKRTVPIEDAHYDDSGILRSFRHSYVDDDGVRHNQFFILKRHHSDTDAWLEKVIDYGIPGAAGLVGALGGAGLGPVGVAGGAAAGALSGKLLANRIQAFLEDKEHEGYYDVRAHRLSPNLKALYYRADVRT